MLADSTAAVTIFFLFIFFPPFFISAKSHGNDARAQAACHAGEQITAAKSGT
jgi:hypothetical protein